MGRGHVWVGDLSQERMRLQSLSFAFTDNATALLLEDWCAAYLPCPVHSLSPAVCAQLVLAPHRNDTTRDHRQHLADVDQVACCTSHELFLPNPPTLRPIFWGERERYIAILVGSMPARLKFSVPLVLGSFPSTPPLLCARLA